MFNQGDIVRRGNRSYRVLGRQTERGLAHGFATKTKRIYTPLVHVVGNYGTKRARVFTFPADQLSLVAAARRAA